MILSEYHRAVEAVLLSAVEPVTTGLLAELLEVPLEEVEVLVNELESDYRDQGRGIVLARVAGGFRFQTHPDMAPFVERFAMEGLSSRLSSAALETLAIVAYKQPVSRAQVAALRGVNVDGVVRLLTQRGLIVEVGQAPGPGQPVLFGTTPAFLEKLGIDTLAQLPPVQDLLPGPEIMGDLEYRLRPGHTAGLTADAGSSPSADSDRSLESGPSADSDRSLESALSGDTGLSVDADPSVESLTDTGGSSAEGD